MEKIDNKYEVGDWLIYPKHGLGKAIDYEVQTILKKKKSFIIHLTIYLMLPHKK